MFCDFLHYCPHNLLFITLPIYTISLIETFMEISTVNSKMKWHKRGFASSHKMCHNSYLMYHINTSVAREGPGGGGGGPNNAISEFCRYIWQFVGTCKPASMSFVPTKYLN